MFEKNYFHLFSAREYKRGEVLFSTGVPPRTLIFIKEGKISNKPKGDNGFGFDPIFELNNGKTLGELTQEEKNKISSRNKALEDLKNKLEIYGL